MTIREIVNEIREELATTPPTDALTVSEYIVKLTAVIGNINDEISQWERSYIARYHNLINENPKMAADKLKILAMDTESYHKLQEAKRYNELVMEMIGGLKYRSRALQGEWGESHNQ